MDDVISNGKNVKNLSLFADYSRTTSLLTFTPTVSSRDVDVPILQDDIVETDETFFGSLDPQGQPAFVAPSEATVTILDNDGDSQLQKQLNVSIVI